MEARCGCLWKTLGPEKMPITTKLRCTHCGSTLKTSKIVEQGAKVRCPKCKEVFHIHASEQDGMAETIPLAGELETFEVELPSSDQQAKTMNATAREPVASDAPPPRMARPSPTLNKKIEYGGGNPFGGSRTIVAAICAAIGVVFAGGFAWWYFGTVKELDVAADVAVERRTATIAKAARPVAAASLKAKPAKPSAVGDAPVPVKVARVTAPMTSEINAMVVGIERATLGPLEGGDGQPVFSLSLRITNNSKQPMKYAGWSRPESKPKLRDAYGNFFNRVSLDSVTPEKSIDPGETITDRLVFEKTSFMAELTLDLPIVGTDQQFEFRMLPSFIERPGGPPPQRLADSVAGSRTVETPPTGRTEQPPPAQVPAKTESYDPETDEKLRGKVLADYRERMKEIKRAKLGKSSNNAATYERSATKKLVERLATDYDLTEDQVKRIVKLK